MNSQLLAQNNLAIIDSLSRGALTELLESYESEINKVVIVNILKFKHSLSSYLVSLISNSFSNEGYEVYRNFPKDTTFESTVFELNKGIISINYSEPFPNTILGKNFVNRHISIEYKGQMYNYGNNKVITPIIIKKNFNDQISYDEIELLENSPYEFTFGVRADISYWQKILEPAIVVTSVLTVLLLLFTQRS